MVAKTSYLPRTRAEDMTAWLREALPAEMH